MIQVIHNHRELLDSGTGNTGTLTRATVGDDIKAAV